LLDALDVPGVPLSKNVWRITRAGREPLRGSALHGRWGVSGEFSVLYTSCEREGALAEIGYRLELEPVWPSKIEHTLHELSAECGNVLDLSDMDFLSSLGVDTTKYESLDYSVTSRIASAASFLEFDALLVPCARYPCNNLVLFSDRPNRVEVIKSSRVDWKKWRQSKN
jgi:RES domain